MKKKKRIKQAPPSTVISIQGFNTPALELSEIHGVKDEQTGKRLSERYAEHKGYDAENEDKNETLEISSKFNQAKRDPSLKRWQRQAPVVLDDEQSPHSMHLLIKADVKGALEAFMEYIHLLPQDQVKIFVVKHGIGPVTETDIDLANKLKAKIFVYNMNVSKSIQALAKNRNVELLSDKIIYNLMDSMQEYGQSVMPYTLEPEVTGTASVNQVFTLNGKQKQQFTSAGCTMKTGILYKKLTRGSKAEDISCRVVRDGTVLFQGAVNTLFHFKDTVDSVKAPADCSITLSGFDRFHKGDAIECLHMHRKQSLYDDSFARQPQHDYLDE